MIRLANMVPFAQGVKVRYVNWTSGDFEPQFLIVSSCVRDRRGNTWDVFCVPLGSTPSMESYEMVFSVHELEAVE